MFLNDLSYIFIWWFYIFIIGIIFLPITRFIFPKFIDLGYIFSKTLGIIFISYSIYILGIYKLFKFTQVNIFVLLIIFFIINIFLFKKYLYKHLDQKSVKKYRPHLILILIQEIIFIFLLIVWSFVRSHAPEINGLEKFMDYGFINSIIRSEYFPPIDMWFSILPINYYYFGHLVTGVLTKLTNIPSSISYNLMLATLLALCFTSVLSITLNIFKSISEKVSIKKSLAAGTISAFIVTFGGNLHTIYTFFLPYSNENPLAPIFLKFNFWGFPNSYWYPNATRFIYNTIHEFPMYSWTVSDLHGHVLDIPFVLLTISILYSIFQIFYKNINLSKKRIYLVDKIYFLLIGFLLSILYMTNAWDGAIYLMLTFFVLIIIYKNLFIFPKKFDVSNNYIVEIFKLNKVSLLNFFASLIIVFVSFILFTYPFNSYFKPFVSGIGVLCAPEFLTKVGTFGPFLFEENHCQLSPIWQLFVLHGFYFIFTLIYLIYILKYKIVNSDKFILILILVSYILILVPEFIYAKDIYPAHYRANTMFKLVFQSFMMLGITTGYIILRILSDNKIKKIYLAPFILITALLLTLIFIYPFMATKSYYGNLQKYQGLDGTNYLKNSRPDDLNVIKWLNQNISDQPVTLEAQGDSYTDYARISANTGLPTVLGWTVHEWLWRGSYDITVPRINDIKTIYESEDLNQTKNLIDKYSIKFIVIGDLEREKYPSLNLSKFIDIGYIVFQSNNTYIFKIN